MCLCKCCKFVTQVLFLVQVIALGSTNREVHMTAEEVLFLETKLTVNHQLCEQYGVQGIQTNNVAFVCKPAILVLNTK